MLLGLRTVFYPTIDLDSAKAWYTELVGHAPYFDEPFYVGYNVGGFELGLLPAEVRTTSTNGHVSYWRVEDIEATH